MSNVRHNYSGKKGTPKYKDTFYIGVEVECLVNNQSKLSYLLKNSSLRNCFVVKHDSSLRRFIKTKDSEVEVNLLLTKRNYITKLKEFASILQKVKAWTNKSCGLHIHLDRYKLNCPYDVYRKFMLLTQSIKNLIPEHRIENDYIDYNHSINNRTDHYNWCNITGKSSFEIRIHEGTVNMKAVTKWIKFLLEIYNYELDSKTMIDCKNNEHYYRAYKNDASIKSFKFTKKTKEYINSRLYLFNYGIKKEEYYV